VASWAAPHLLIGGARAVGPTAAGWHWEVGVASWATLVCSIPGCAYEAVPGRLVPGTPGLRASARSQAALSRR
jgi:hypothetical protein